LHATIYFKIPFLSLTVKQIEKIRLIYSSIQIPNEMVIACLAYGAAALYAYAAGRIWHDAYRYVTAENKVRDKFDLSHYPTKYDEYPEGYAQELEKSFRSIKFPSWLTKRSLDKLIEEAHSKTRKRPIDDHKGL
jgi:hypothetical protein